MNMKLHIHQGFVLSSFAIDRGSRSESLNNR